MATYLDAVRRILASTSLLCVSHTLAQSTPPRLQACQSPPVRAQPLRIARLGPDFRMEGDWIDYPGTVAGVIDATMVYDCYEVDETGIPIGGEDCNPNFDGSTRWYFGSTYCNMFVANDMEIGPGAVGATVSHIATRWYWTGERGRSEERCLVAVATADVFDDTCAGPSYSDPHPGIVVDFGELSTNTNYITVIDLDQIGLAMSLPNTRRGAHILILGKDIDEFNGIELASCGQFFLWGTGDGEVPEDDRPGSQGPLQWDDDVVIDFAHDPATECDDEYGQWGLCPDPLGATVTFWSRDAIAIETVEPVDGPVEPCGLSGFVVPELRGGENATLRVDAPALAGETVGIFWSFQTGRYEASFPGQDWCLSLSLDLGPDPRLNALCEVQLDDDGHGACTISIPDWALGATVHFQAALRGTCPETCTSPLRTRTVQP